MFYRQLKSGNWVFRESYKNPLTNKWQEVSCTFGKNNREVRKKAQMLLDEKIRKKLVELQAGGTSDITFAELKDKYLKIAKNQVTYRTYYGKTIILKRVSEDWGKNVIARKITPQFINRYLTNLLYKKNFSNSTVNSYKTNIKVCYEFGVSSGFLNKNPVDDVRIRFKNEAVKRQNEIENKYLEDNEYHKILSYCDEKHREDIKDLFIWLYETGMRCGEAIGLQKKNIMQDINGRWFARVEGSLIEMEDIKGISRKRIKSASAKTFAGNRDVYLTPESQNIAIRHMKDKENEDFIFTNNDLRSSGYFNISKLDLFLKRAEKKKKINKHLTTHIFRHTHVTKLTEMGWPLSMIKRRVGHKSSKITTEIYTHITHKQRDYYADKIKEFPTTTTSNKNLHIVNK